MYLNKMSEKEKNLTEKINRNIGCMLIQNIFSNDSYQFDYIFSVQIISDSYKNPKTEYNYIIFC